MDGFADVNRVGAGEPDPKARFIRDAAGRMIFHPFGPLWRGYVVTDARREQELRDWYDNSTGMEVALTAIGLPFLMAAFYYVWGMSHSIGAAMMIAPIVVSETWRRRRIARLVVGLERVPPANQAGRRILKPPMWFLGLWVPFVVWIYWTYAPDRMPPPTGADVAFYTDITIPLFSSILFGFITIFMASKFRFDHGRNKLKSLIIAVLLLPFNYVMIFGSVELYFRQKPEIVISENSILCGQGEAKWDDVADVRLAHGSKGSRRARLILNKAGEGDASSSARPNILSCNVGATTAEPDVVYDAIYAAWQRRRSQ